MIVKENIFKGTLPQFAAVISGSLVAISDGMQYGWTAPVLPILLGPNSPVQTTKQQGEWLENCVWIGAFGGLWVTMYLVDKLGRKRSILLSAFLSLIIWVVMAVAPRIEYIIAARALAGAVGNTAFVATPMYIAEIAEQNIRGLLSSMIYLSSLVGIFLIYSVAPFVPFYVHCTIGAVIVLIELLTFPFMPESPYYLLYKERPEEAKKSLMKLRREGANIDNELKDMKYAITRQKEERGRIQDIFVISSNRKAIIIMAVLNVAQHFSGVSVILMNLHTILAAGGTVYLEPSTTGILFAMLMVLSAGAASFSMDKFGRKSLLMLSSLFTGSCLMVIAIYFAVKNSGYDTATFSWIPIVCVMAYAVVFKAGLGIVPIVLTAELFPAKVKAYGMALADGMYVLGSIFSLLIYQSLLDNFGMEYPFYIFSICCYLVSLFAYFYIPETKGKSLEQIQMILKGENDDHLNKNEK